MNGGENISFLVCHMEKYHKTDIIGVEQENERDENYQVDNPQINDIIHGVYCPNTDYFTKLGLSKYNERMENLIIVFQSPFTAIGY